MNLGKDNKVSTANEKQESASDITAEEQHKVREIMMGVSERFINDKFNQAESCMYNMELLNSANNDSMQPAAIDPLSHPDLACKPTTFETKDRFIKIGKL